LSGGVVELVGLKAGSWQAGDGRKAVHSSKLIAENETTSGTGTLDCKLTQIDTDSYTPCCEGYSQQGDMWRLRRDI